MIDRQQLADYINSRLEGTNHFLVDVTVTPDNRITVEIDSDGNTDIDTCVELTRAIEAEFDRDKEDYELEVGSAGLTAPFKVLRQYTKNIGNEVETLASDGKKYRGRLAAAGHDSFTIVCTEKVRPEGAKRPVEQEVEHTFPYSGVKYTKYLLQF